MAFRRRQVGKERKTSNGGSCFRAPAGSRNDDIEVVDDLGEHISVFPEELTVLESFLSQAIHEILGDVVHKQTSKLKRD